MSSTARFFGESWQLRVTLAALLLGSSLALHGEVRSSANYSVEAETLDGGGGLSTSTDYANEASLEELVAGKSISTNYVVLHGFITGLTVTFLDEYDTWVQARGLTAGVNAGYFDDPNHDGRPNISHFAFDTDPLGGGGTEDKRQCSTTNIGGLDYFTLTIPVRHGAIFSGTPLLSNVVDGISYEILGDTDLDDPWILPVVELIPALDAGLPSLGDYDGAGGADWLYRTFRLTEPLSASPRYFLKAGVTVAP